MMHSVTQTPPALERRAAPQQPKRVKTPTIIQMEAVECGAAALGIILGYFGRIVPLEELRHACGISRDGSKASNLVRAARGYGLIARGFRKEPRSLKSMPVPMILFWESNHFLILEGFGKGQVYLNDPRSGPLTVTEEELERLYSGVALTFEPRPDFKKGGHAPGLLRTLRRRIVGSEIGLVYAVIAGLCLVVPGLAAPAFAKVFVDRVLVDGLLEWVPHLLLAMTLMLGLQVCLSWLQQYQLMRLGQRLGLTAAGQFFWHVLQLPAEYFTLRYAGDIAARVRLNDQVAHFLSSQLTISALNVLIIAFYALIMLQYSVVLTVTGVGIALLNLVALRYVSRRRIDLNRRLQQDNAKLLSTSFSGLQMIETLKATGSEDDFFSRWAGFQAKALSARQELGAASQYLAAVPTLLGALGTLVILAMGGELVMAGGMSLGALIAFQYLMASFSQPIASLVNLGSNALEMEASLNRLDDVLNYPADRALADREQHLLAAPTTPRLTGQLELRNVTFGYSRLDPPLIEDLSITLRPGARVALVGDSGSGKSTIARLVCGLYAPWSGQILFDGQPRDAYPRRVITNSLALVDQEIFLFEGTVHDNLTLWDTTIAEPRIVAAARDAGIHSDVAARAGGYDSHVEEDGANFSGGQRQRLEIARALVSDPSILVLDEATSALDPLTEQSIDENLRRRGCTYLLVAHRLSTIRDCEEILVLERGKVVQRGTHEQMKKVAGPYARLIAAE
jgi:NHLM bacteriocin system ABC transporter peptidase/ATP-binding protein